MLAVTPNLTTVLLRRRLLFNIVPFEQFSYLFEQEDIQAGLFYARVTLLKKSCKSKSRKSNTNFAFKTICFLGVRE
jgi:hypothetical protein